ILGVIPTAAGILLGGLFIRKCLPGPRFLTSFITIVETVVLMGFLSALFLGCPESQFDGNSMDTHFEMQSMCNDNCFCSETKFQPICGPDNKTNYFSPCFAGCKTQSIIEITNTTNKQYSNCDCFDGSANEGYCATDCGNNLHIYVLLLGINEEDKSFAVGLMRTFMCLFAFIPYPLVYGAVVDGSCLIWESKCGHRGNCWVYDTYNFRRNLHGLTLGLYFIGIIFDVIVIFLSKRIKNLYNDEIDEQKMQILSKMTNNKSVESESTDHMCGLGSWRPKWLQIFGSTNVFMVILGGLAISQGASFTYMIASITTLEKRYAFGSTISGIILIADNVAELILSPIFAALPYFIYGPGVHLLSGSNKEIVGHLMKYNKSTEFCDQNNFDNDMCGESGGSETVILAVVILCIASFFNGLGFATFVAIGIPFIDDSVDKKNSPVYIGLVSGLRLCGPTSVDPGIERKDPRWIGAWWIGFLVIGTSTLLFSIPMLFFPRSIWKRTKRLLKNPIFVCYTIGTASRMFAMSGYMTFKAKYIESEYKTSASKANLFSGVIPIATGIFLGGVFIRKFLPGPRLLTSLITIVELFAVTGFVTAIFLGCPQSQFAGTQHNTHFEMQSMCNDNCFCSETKFQPICGPDNKTNYFSPCFAGLDKDDKTFIPYPLVYGAVVDATCLIWESKCGHSGNCWAYDTNKFRLNLHGLTLGLYLFGSFFDVIVIFLSKRIKNLYNDEIDEQELEIQNNDMKLKTGVNKPLANTVPDK
ncbi:unnamed protein product, partial [Medioppia subpectinata]